MKIYMDSCCYNRPFDDQTQERIRLESEAILTILKRGQTGKYKIIGSSILELEIDQMHDERKKRNVSELYKVTNLSILYTDEIRERAREIVNMSNIKTFDSLHVAAAESANADVLLTTDDKFEKIAAKLDLKVRVLNPLKFIWEVI